MSETESYISDDEMFDLSEKRKTIFIPTPGYKKAEKTGNPHGAAMYGVRLNKGGKGFYVTIGERSWYLENGDPLFLNLSPPEKRIYKPKFMN